MNNFEYIKAMGIEQLAAFIHKKFCVCELDKPCSKCENQDWCNCSSVEDFITWLKSDVN